MYRSITITAHVGRPVAEVYAFLADPMNTPAWHGQVQRMQHRHGRDWIVGLGEQDVAVRVSPRNAFGVLDTWIMVPGRPEYLVPFRVYPNGNGTELAWTHFQLPGMSDERFRSEAEWIRTDLLALTTLLEAMTAQPAIVGASAQSIRPAPQWPAPTSGCPCGSS